MKNDSFSKELFSLGEMMKDGASRILSNSGRAVAIITALVSVLVTFTDVAFLGFGSREMTASAIIMLICSYLIYFSLVSAGERIGEESEEYVKAMESYAAVREKVTPDDTARLREFCRRYAREEHTYRVDSMLSSEGLSREELEDYRGGRIKDFRRRLALGRISREREIRLTPAMLLSGKGQTHKRELVSPLSARIKSFVGELLPSTLCVLFTASIILTAKSDLGTSEIIGGIVKLATLPIIGFRGYCSGYFYVRDTLSLWVESKRRLLEDFLGEKKDLKTEE